MRITIVKISGNTGYFKQIILEAHASEKRKVEPCTPYFPVIINGELWCGHKFGGSYSRVSRRIKFRLMNNNWIDRMTCKIDPNNNYDAVQDAKKHPDWCF